MFLAANESQTFSKETSSLSNFISVSNLTESQKHKNNFSNFSGSSLPPTGFSSTNSNNNFITLNDSSHTSNAKSTFFEQNTTTETKSDLKTGVSPTTIVLKPRRSGGGLSNKQRSFTTSILVSPRSDKKLAAIIAERQTRQKSIEENKKTTSPTIYSNYNATNNDLSFIKLSLNNKKFDETSRSYQRLTQDDDSLNENKIDEKINCNKKQEKKFSGNKVIVDIKNAFF